MWQSGHTLHWSAKRLLALLASVLFITGGVPARAKTPRPDVHQETQAKRDAVSQTQAQTLEYGRAITRELASVDVHAYELRLDAGQFVHVLVDQRGIDVVVRVYGPDGKQVAEVDGPTGMQGPEPVYLVAEADGNYRLEIRSLETGAAPGSYEVSIKELRRATAQDGTRISAQTAYADGDRARLRGTKASREEAIKTFEEARRLYIATGDRTREGAVLHIIGTIYSSLGERQKALEYYSQALPLRQAEGDRSGEAYTLTNMGAAYTSLGEAQKALEYQDRALPLWRAIGDRTGEAATLHNMGLIYDALGEKQKSLEYFNKALSLRKAIGDRDREAYTLTGIGVVYYSLGETQKALEYYDQALSLRRTIRDRSGEADALNNIGVVYASMGEMQKALEYYDQALPLRKAVGDRRGEAYTLSNIGVVHYLLGAMQKALEYHNQALPLRKALGDRRGEAITLQSLGLVYVSLGEKQKSAEYFAQALQLWRAVGDRSGEAGTLRSIARLERDQGNLTNARLLVSNALPLVESIRSNVATQELRASFFATVRDHYELYIDILMRSHQLDPSAGYAAEALQVSERARARSLLELLIEARADIRQGVDPQLAERERNLRDRLNAKLEYQIRLLSARHTSEQVAAAGADIARLTTEFEQVQGQIRTTSPAYAALTQPQPLTLREIQQQVLDPETLLLEYSLGSEGSYLWLVSDSSLSSFTLPKRAQLEAAAIALTRLLSEGGTAEDFERQATVVSRLLLAPVAPYLGRKRLVIVADGALVYVPFAALPRLSESNRRGKPLPLVATNEIVSLPSAATLASLRRQLAGRRPAAKQLAVFADPVFNRDDPRIRTSPLIGRVGHALPAAAGERRDAPAQQEYVRAAEAARSLGLERAGIDLRRLPFSRQEAVRLLALVPRREALAALDFKASQATAMSPEVGEYKIVHFATHGYLNPQQPELSGLVLSLVDERGEPQDGFLSLPEVYNLRLPVELVVLSACQTGLGKQVQGEGLVGLTRGFMYAGAPRVVASLWAVQDRATAEMMGHFYEAMLRRGLRPAAALRAAQLRMQREERWSAPRQWAGFIFQGEWR
jgi:CHAT domain-containing protein/tetratricopeptide (TPR) repeat protein